MVAQTVLSPVRCPNCRKRLAERVEGKVEFRCERCRAFVAWLGGVWYIEPEAKTFVGNIEIHDVI